VTRTSRPAAGAGSGTVDVVVIGAGHSGLAISHCLTARAIDHVVLERGEVANTWRCERWDSLRLLTPNWLSRLPGWSYHGTAPDGFMTASEVAGFISDYAALSGAPVQARTTVTSVSVAGGGYWVRTDRGDWRCRAVMLASGACNLPLVPTLSGAVPKGITQLTAHEYRNPRQLEPGAVLVVGASATGMQLADELQRAGHEVTLAVGEHVRMPRSYRGRDILWWMNAAGVSDQKYDEVDDILRARRVPSPQLVGSMEQPFMDINALTSRGVRVVGKLAGIRNGKAQFSGSLRNVCAMADLKMNRLLATVDEWAESSGHGAHAGPAERFEPTRIDGNPCLGLDLESGEIRTVLWATGYRPDYSWLELPVLDRKGQVRHDGGVGAIPGLYVIGLPFLRRRKSSFIHGAEDDARDLTDHLARWLATASRQSRKRMAV
jgi:putative flavoprotein involved in K+ transport